MQTKRIGKVLAISLLVILGLATGAFGAYYVYEHKEELPFIKNFFASDRVEPDGSESSDTTAPTWIIEIARGNVVKIDEDGSTTVLADKDDYENVREFTFVSTSPDYSHMCFLGETIVPTFLFIAKTDGSDVIEDGIAETCVWSNDSSMIAYINHTTDVSPHDIYVYFMSTGETTNFTRHLSADHEMRVYEDPVWSDDDTFITSLYNSYDDRDNWAQTTGYSIIYVRTGEVRDVSSTADISDWILYRHDESGVSFSHPPSWTVTESCDTPHELCSLEATDGNYVWVFDFDPFVTGGGFGYLFDSGSISTTIRTRLSIDSYDTVLLTNYYNGSDLVAEMNNRTIPTDSELWGWSVTFTDPNNFSTLGFGPGEMYDQIENNRWSILYKYTLTYPTEGSMDFSEVPLKDDTDLEEAILIMNAISESVNLPE